MPVIDPRAKNIMNADCDCLTPEPLHVGWGMLYQSSYANDWVWQLPSPVVIVQMNGDTQDRRLLDRSVVRGIIDFSIDDTPGACLPDDVYVGLIMSVVVLLASGVNVLSHCAAGVSRSGYVSIGAVMAALDVPFPRALLLVRAQRPIIKPNPGFEAQMVRLQGRLRRLHQDSWGR
jgi:hypothetical protein